MLRPVLRISKSRPTLEGAGVHLHRAFGFQEVPDLDPFLLLDDFRSDNPDHYLPGFPWHPHRGIETITYVLEGRVEHGDSMGNKGVIGPGDVQWMTAGNGVVHQEMPQGDKRGRMGGFQLWANLPASQKMMDPRYRDVKAATIPEAVLDGGVKVKVVCGTVGGVCGPVRDIVVDPQYLDVQVPSGFLFHHPVKRGHNAFAYLVEGEAIFGGAPAGSGTLVVFGDGDAVEIKAGKEPFRFLMVSGRPLKEPVAWHGPIVMNTREDLETAYQELQDGTFLRHAGTDTSTTHHPFQSKHIGWGV